MCDRLQVAWQSSGQTSGQGVGLVINSLQVRLLAVHCWVSTWTGDRLQAGKPSRYVTGHLGQLGESQSRLYTTYHYQCDKYLDNEVNIGSCDEARQKRYEAGGDAVYNATMCDID